MKIALGYFGLAITMLGLFGFMATGAIAEQQMNRRTGIWGGEAGVFNRDGFSRATGHKTTTDETAAAGN